MAKKVHEWVVRALQENGYNQADLSREWGKLEGRPLDDAVVSRWIGTGAPKLTVGRILVLAQMLKTTSDVVMAHAAEAEGIKVRPPAPPTPVVSSRPKVVVMQRHDGEALHAAPGGGNDVAAALANAQEAVRRVQELLPNAKVHFSVVLNNGDATK